MDEFKVYLVGNKHCAICLKTPDEAKLLSKHNAVDFFSAIKMLQSTPWICAWCSSKLRHFQDLRSRARRSEALLSALRYNLEQVKGNKHYYAGLLQQLKTELYMPVMRQVTAISSPISFQSTTTTSIDKTHTERSAESTRTPEKTLGRNESILYRQLILNELPAKCEPATKTEPEDLEYEDFFLPTDTPGETGNGDKVAEEPPIDGRVSRLRSAEFNPMSKDPVVTPYDVGRQKPAWYSSIAGTITLSQMLQSTTEREPLNMLTSTDVSVVDEHSPSSSVSMPVQAVAMNERTLSLRSLIKEGKEIILDERDSIMYIFEEFIDSNARSVRMTEVQEKYYNEESLNNVKYKRKPYKCQLCVTGFYREHYYKVHLWKHTSESGIFACDKCKLHYKTEDALRSHTLSQHYVYSCTSCSRVFRNIRYVLNHAVLEHSSVTIRCEHCDKRFKSPTQFKKHQAMHNYLGNEIKCAICAKTFPRSVENWKELFITHIRSHKDPGEVVQCSVCEELVPRCRLKKHTETHTSELTCTLCDKSYATSYCLEMHKLRCHSKKKYQCDVCSKEYVNKTELTRHITWIHMKIGLRCKKCRQLFQSKPKLQRHLKIVHQKIPLPKNIICDICGKAFSTRVIMQTHRLIHIGSRPHVCEHCGKTFRQRGAMRTHTQLVHEGVRYRDLVAARKLKRDAKTAN